MGCVSLRRVWEGEPWPVCTWIPLVLFFFSPYDLTMYPYVSVGNLIVVCLVYLVPPGLPAGATQGSWKTFLSVGEGVPQPKLPNCLWLGQGTMKLPGPDYLL